MTTHTRLTRTSSDLRLLSVILTPPSPILKPDDLLFNSTSGEIPILLEAEGHACDSPLHTFTEPLGLYDVTEELELTDRLKHVRTIQHPGGGIGTSEESDAMYIAARLRHSEYSSDTTSILPDNLKDAIRSVRYDIFDCDDEHSNIFRDGGKQGQFGGLRDPHPPPTMEMSSATVMPELGEDLDNLLVFATFHTYSTLPTPTFAPPSPSPSADVISPLSSPVSQQRYRRPLERARAVRFPGRSRSPQLHANGAGANLVHSPPPSPDKQEQAFHPRLQLTNAVPTASTYSFTRNIHVPSTAHLAVKQITLPEELSWLRDMSIELWIDQEGFRAVRPCMQLMGYSPRTRSLHPYESGGTAGTGVTAGVAEFMPTKREAFVFHYAALDCSPTLRMVSIVGDESRDHISRQVALSVKTNGVYTVLGTETLTAQILNSDSPRLRLQNVRLRWKFDYLVSDRKADGTGKTLSGEKTLTPLTFSCSPYLFHPFQGKKAGLIHIMKKNLTPKLGSQKLEPPVCASMASIIPPASRYFLMCDAACRTHTRSHSDAFAKGHYSFTRSPLGLGLRGNQMPRVRRRRASSAGENMKNEVGDGFTL